MSMLGIAFNLIMKADFVSVKITDRSSHAGEYVGSSGDITGGKHQSLENIYRISSFVSFFSIWLTTATFNELQVEVIKYYSIFGHIVYPTCVLFDNLLLSVFLIRYSKLLSNSRSSYCFHSIRRVPIVK